MVQKCRINQAPPYLSNFSHDRLSVSERSTRNKAAQLNLVPKCRLSIGQRSFAFRGARKYNLLPDNIRATYNVSSFKRKAAAHILGNIFWYFYTRVTRVTRVNISIRKKM